MNEERAIVVGFVALVAGSALLSGPALGVVNLTETPSSESYGFAEGSITVGDVEFPDRAVLRAGRYGAEVHYLEIDPARLDLQRVIGQPAVTYSISVDELGIKRESLHFVTPEEEGIHNVTMGELNFEEEVSADSLSGEVSINVRHSTASYTVANSTVDIDVVR